MDVCSHLDLHSRSVGEHQLAVVRERQELLEVEVGAAVDQKDAPRLDDAAPQQQPRELSFRGVGELRAQGRW